MLVPVAGPAFADMSGRIVIAQAVSPDETLWKSIKDLSMPDLLEQFIKRYPDSTHRAEAEARLAELAGDDGTSADEQAAELLGDEPGNEVASAAEEGDGPIVRQVIVGATGSSEAGEAVVDGPLNAEVAGAIIAELDRAGCGPGDTGEFYADATEAMKRFSNATGMAVTMDGLSAATVTILKAAKDNVCATEVVESGAEDEGKIVYTNKPAVKSKSAKTYTAKKTYVPKKTYTEKKTWTSRKKVHVDKKVYEKKAVRKEAYVEKKVYAPKRVEPKKVYVEKKVVTPKKVYAAPKKVSKPVYVAKKPKKQYGPLVSVKIKKKAVVKKIATVKYKKPKVVVAYKKKKKASGGGDLGGTSILTSGGGGVGSGGGSGGGSSGW